MTETQAEKVNIALLQILGTLDQTAAFVKDHDSEEDWLRYRKAVAHAMSGVIDLSNTLYFRFPSLKPEQIGGTYKVDRAIYKPEFYALEKNDT